MTKMLKAKLRSKAGVSMLIALLFLMFCVFIGGTVLAAATANGRRVEQLASQQEQLISRSTAMLLGDELQLDPDESLRIKVLDVDKTIYEIQATDGHYELLSTAPVRKREVTFTVDIHLNAGHKLKPLQRLQIEAAILRYIQEHPSDDQSLQPDIKIVGFIVDGVEITKNDFWLKTDLNGNVEGSLQVEATHDTVDIPGFDLTVSCGSGDDCYDLLLATEGTASVRVRLRAYDNTVPTPGPAASELPENPTSLTQLPEGSYEVFPEGYSAVHRDCNMLYVITHEQYNVAIGWEDPLVEKGGVE